jgi:hypothetical protein
MPDFQSVAEGRRTRARWRAPGGWVRAERVSDRVVRLRGSHSDLYAIWHAQRRDWRCLRANAGEPPLHATGVAGQHELYLERKA